jgi:DNA-directed RNA polymerase specialized sigma24 family protein
LNPTHLKMIQQIAKRLANKYVFGYFDVADIEQEAIIFGLEAYDRWDETRPLENFISVHMSNRLKNFKRDNYFRLGLEESSPKRQKSNETKRNLMKPAAIHPFSLFTEESIDNQDSIDFLMSQMPPLIKNDFLRMSNGVTITKGRKQAVIDSVKEILGEDW